MFLGTQLNMRCHAAACQHSSEGWSTLGTVDTRGTLLGMCTSALDTSP